MNALKRFKVLFWTSVIMTILANVWVWNKALSSSVDVTRTAVQVK